MQTAPATNHCQMYLRLLPYLKLGFVLPRVWCGSKPNQRCLSPHTHPTKKKKSTNIKSEQPTLPSHLLLLCSTSTTPSRCSKDARTYQAFPSSTFSFLFYACLSLHHVHGVLGEKGVDVGEGWAELAVSVPATQHELIETLRTHSGPAQIYLQKKARRRYMDVSPLLRHSLYLFICDNVLTITYKYEKNFDFPLLLINMSYITLRSVSGSLFIAGVWWLTRLLNYFQELWF